MTYEQALNIWRYGNPKFAVPPVYTGNWDEADWIMWCFGIAKPRNTRR